MQLYQVWLVRLNGSFKYGNAGKLGTDMERAIFVSQCSPRAPGFNRLFLSRNLANEHYLNALGAVREIKGGANLNARGMAVRACRHGLVARARLAAHRGEIYLPVHTNFRALLPLCCSG